MTTTRRSRTTTKVASAGAGLGLAVLAVLGFSNAAFNVQTDPNADNNWATGGSIELNEQFTAPMFSFGLNDVGKPTSDGTQLATYDGYLAEDPADLNESDAGVRSIDIAYVGNVDADVRMYVNSDYAQTNDLDDHTLVTVKRGDTTLIDGVALSSLPTSYDDADETAWDVTNGDETATYTVSIEDDGTAPDDSTVTGVEFTWEAQKG